MRIHVRRDRCEGILRIGIGDRRLPQRGCIHGKRCVHDDLLPVRIAPDPGEDRLLHLGCHRIVLHIVDHFSHENLCLFFFPHGVRNIEDRCRENHCKNYDTFIISPPMLQFLSHRASSFLLLSYQFRTSPTSTSSALSKTITFP